MICDVLANGDALLQAALLSYGAYLLAGLDVIPPRIETIGGHRAGIHQAPRRERAYGDRLSGAVGAEEPVDLPLRTEERRLGK